MVFFGFYTHGKREIREPALAFLKGAICKADDASSQTCDRTPLGFELVVGQCLPGPILECPQMVDDLLDPAGHDAYQIIAAGH